MLLYIRWSCRYKDITILISTSIYVHFYQFESWMKTMYFLKFDILKNFSHIVCDRENATGLPVHIYPLRVTKTKSHNLSIVFPRPPFFLFLLLHAIISMMHLFNVCKMWHATEHVRIRFPQSHLRLVVQQFSWRARLVQTLNTLNLIKMDASITGRKKN